MTIKKQISILTTLIIAIPVLCLCMIYLHQYITSSSSFIMAGSKKNVNFNEEILTEKEYENIYEVLRLLPQNIEACIITNDNLIVYSTFSNMLQGNTCSQNELWNYIRGTSEQYFYQFTAMKLSDTRVILITRLSRNKSNSPKTSGILFPIMLLLTILVIISLIFIVLISKTIFRSIVTIENKTKQIADGDLYTKIITKDQDYKENEITTTLISLDKMRIALLEEQNRKNKFIMGISHDLRTPVAIIKGYIEAISDEIITDKSEIENAFQLIQNKTSQLESMIDSLISFMKMNDKEIRENLIPLSITKIVNEFAKDAKITANVFKRTIISNINLSEDIIIPLNEQLVLRSLQNLFSNALRYTKNNDSIEINAFSENSFVYIQIKDTGIGIDEKDLKYIFDMFYRGTNSRQEEGMGIGLSVVQNIINTHGWSITVDSKKGQGSCFTIEIPI